jgi:hypothetical protein
MKLASPLLKPTTLASRVGSASVASTVLPPGGLAVDSDGFPGFGREVHHAFLFQLEHADVRGPRSQAGAVVLAGTDAGLAGFDPVHADQRQPAIGLGQALHALHAASP